MLKRTRIALGVLLILVLAAGLLQTPLLAATRRAVWSGLVTLTGYWWNIDDLTYDAGTTDQLSRLRAENIRLKSELADYVALREQLGQPSIASLRALPAVVAGEPLDVFRTHILLNQGALDGVVIGAPVVIEGSTLIGFISDMGEHTAVCRLLFNPATSISAEVADTPYARGLVTGHLYTSLLLGTVPRDAELAAGQSVVTVANDMVPAGLVVGEVERVYNEENEAYQQARLRVAYDMDAVRGVTILVQP